MQLSVKPAAMEQEGKFWHPLFKPSIPSMGFPESSVGKESICNARDHSLIPRLGRSPGEGKGYPFQYAGLEKTTDCIVHGVAKSWTWLSNFHFHCSQHTVVQQRKKIQILSLCQRQREKNGPYIQSSDFSEGCQRDRILFCLSLGALEKNSTGLG